MSYSGPTPNISNITPGNGSLTVTFTNPDGYVDGAYQYQYSLSTDGGTTWGSWIIANTSPMANQSAGPFTFTISGLTNGQTYHVRVRTQNVPEYVEWFGYAPYSQNSNVVSATPMVPTTVPPAPVITAVPGDGKIRVSFTQSGDGNSPITNYKYSFDGTTYTAFDPAVTSSPIVIGSLTNDQQYTVQLIAVNSVGDSTASNSVTVTPTTTVPAPTITSIVPGDGSATVNFSINYDPTVITNYTYSLNSLPYVAFSPAVTGTSAVISGLTNGRTYSVSLKAISSGVETAASSSATVVPFTSTTISNLTQWFDSTGISGTQWTNKVATGTTMALASPQPGVSGNAIVVGAATGGITGTISLGTTWTFVIAAKRAVIAGGQSSNKSYYFAPTDNRFPVLLDDYAINGSMGTLEIFGSTGFSAADTNDTYRYQITPTLGENKFIASYSISSNAINVYYNGQNVLTNKPYINPNISATMNRLFSQPNGTERFTGEVYEILMFNKALNSDEFNTVHNYLAGRHSISAVSVPTSVPAAPSSLVPAPGNAQIGLSFTQSSDGSSPITNYKYSFDNVTYTALSPADITSPILLTDGIVNDTDYTIYLKATNSVGDSLASVPVTTRPSATLQPPVITTITSANDTSLTVNFNPGSAGPSTIANYKYSINGGAYVEFSPAVTSGPLTITGLTAIQKYTVRLKAVAADSSESAESNAAEGVTFASTTVSNLTQWFDSTGISGSQWTNRITTGANLSLASPVPDVSNNAVILTSATGGITGTVSLNFTWSVFIAAKRSAIGGEQKSYYLTPSDNRYPTFLDDYEASPNTLELFGGSAMTRSRVTSALNEDKFIASFVVSNSTVNAFYNGKTAISNLAYTNSFSNAVYNRFFSGVNDTDKFTGSVYEVLMFNTNLSTANINRVHQYLSLRHSIGPFTPDAPIFPAIVPSNGSLSISAVDSTTGGSTITGYKYSINGGSYTSFSSFPLVLNGLTNKTSYNIGLIAVNAAGDGNPLTFSATPDWSWTQVGNTTLGEAAANLSGTSVALSADGNVLAIGAPNNAGNGTNSGHVRVFSRSGSSWIQRGNDIDGEALSNLSGTSISLSDDGNILAIGAHGNTSGAGHVRVYVWNGTTWVQRGTDIDGPASSQFGRSVELSSDGNTLVVGAPGTNSGITNAGRLRVVRWSGSSWNQIGQDINGVASNGQLGIRTSISGNTNVVSYYDASGGAGILTRVFNESTNQWDLRGSKIADALISSLNEDGTILAVASSSKGPLNLGFLTVYNWNGSSWQQIGNTINGEASNDSFGASLAINKAGTIVAIGASSSDTTTGNPVDNRGRVRVFTLVGSTWTQLGLNIDGLVSVDAFGTSVALTGDGYTLAVGAIGADGTTGNPNDNRGEVRVYNLAVPVAPANLSASSGDGSMTFSFTAGNDAPITSYVYTLNGQNPTTVSLAAASSPITVTGLTNGQSYTLSVQAVSDINGVGSGPASTTIVTPVGPPGAPSINVASAGNKSATVFFTPGSDGGSPITGYNVSVNGTWSSTLLTPLTDGSGAQYLLVTGLTNGTNSDILIRAVNASGDGAVSPMGVSVNPISIFASSFPSGILASNALGTIQTLTIDPSNATINLANLVQTPIANIPDASDQKQTRENLINLIFNELENLTQFKTSFVDLGLPAIRPNITEAIVFKQDPSGSSFTPPSLDSVMTASTVIYVTLSAQGAKNTFSYKSGSFSIEKLEGESYKLTLPDGQQQTFATGDVTTLDDLTIKFSGSATVSLTNSPVVVNLDVSINANGNISVLGDTTKPTPMNVIVAQTTLPVSVLYDAPSTIEGGVSYFDGENAPVNKPNSLFEFWEPSGTVLDASSIDLSANNPLGQRQATKCLPNGSDRYRDYRKLTKHFVKSLHNVLEGSFDCSAATPYNDIKYTQPAYKTQENFGRVALSNYAHYLFGHIAATTAITNDQDFVNAMLSRVSVNGNSNYDVNGNIAYKYNTAASVEGSSTGSTWLSPAIGSASDADLARLLVGKIVNKPDSDILKIVNQVLGQDASRAMDEDNNALAPNVRQALKFIPGDVIYMNIRLQKPNVSVGGGQQVAGGTLEGKYSAEVNYTLKITLQ